VTRAQAKLQRWIDLIAVLLTHRYGVTFEKLRVEVPGYARGSKRDAVARTFERDKDELRALGVPIETLEPTAENEGHQRYRIDPGDMYLPYLVIAASGRPSRADPRRLRPGYRSVPTLSFEPDEYEALVNGARRAVELGDPMLAHDATAALRKLAFDLPIDSALGVSVDHVTPQVDHPTAERLRPLGLALLRLKRVRFTYHGMARDTISSRIAEPYGLFFLSNHWYLAARDVDGGALRNFRVSRMRDIAPNTREPHSPDYEIPDEFRLSTHAVDRHPWEIGDGDALEVVVRFHGTGGAAEAALKHGRPGPEPRSRVFQVRRTDAFCRWILSFADEAVPLSPSELVDEYRSIARATLAVYGESS
jgi:proteasome accessory factor B